MNQHTGQAPVREYIGNNLLLLLIFLLALFLRIYHLSSESMWLDEVYSVVIANRSPIGIVKEIIVHHETNPPLYYVLLHYWISVFGDSEFASRLMSAIPGTLSVLLIYKLGKELFNKNTGLLASLIMAVSVFQIEYSQEARTYSLIVFLTLLSNYFFLRLLSGYKSKYVVGYLLTGLVLIFDHYYWVFYIAAQNIYVFTKLILNPRVEWPAFKRWILLQLTFIVISIPEFLFLSGTYTKQGFKIGSPDLANIDWIERPHIKAIIDTLLQFSGSAHLLKLYIVLSFNTVLIAFGVYFGIFYKNRFKEITSRPSGLGHDSPFYNKIDRLYFLIVLLFVPIVLPFFVSRTYTPIYLDRYMIGTSSVLYILVAEGINNLGFTKLKVFTVVLIVCLSFLIIYRYYVTVNKHQWREAVQYIEQNASPGDLILVYPEHELDSLGYYLKRIDLKTSSLPRIKPNLDFRLNDQKAWVIFSDIGLAEVVNDSTLKEYNKLLLEKDFNEIKIYLLTGKPD